VFAIPISWFATVRYIPCLLRTTNGVPQNGGCQNLGTVLFMSCSLYKIRDNSSFDFLSVRSAQNEKAHIRSAKNRERKKGQHGDQPLPSEHSNSPGPCISNNVTTPHVTGRNPKSSDIQLLRLQVVNWQMGWGAESLWEKEFNNDLRVAREEGRVAVDEFFEACDKHAKAGREILMCLRAIGLSTRIGTVAEMRDIFLQTYDLVLAISSKVKFFEVKLDEFAPAVPMTKMSDIRYYSEM